MARIPDGAFLIDNPVSQAPGFQTRNVFTLAGVPQIMRGMLPDITHRIEGGATVFQITVAVSNVGEGDAAARLSEIEMAYPGVSIGSYPWFNDELRGVNFVARGTDEAVLATILSLACLPIPPRPQQNSTAISKRTACATIFVFDGAYRAWAVAASYGDNFPAMAERLAHGHDLPLEALKTLGEMANYNGYGATEADLHFHPAALYREMAGFPTPMAFLSEKPDVMGRLTQGYADDFRMAEGSNILASDQKGEIRVLPDAAASRRISGMFGNQLAQENPNRAHAILTEQDGGFLVSIRAPISSRSGADTLALQFETGGGRSAAAGINHLETANLDRFIEAFRGAF